MERHPFGEFVPRGARCLILGSFIAKRKDKSYDWFYSNKTNQFWPIMEKVYGTRLTTKAEKKRFLRKRRMAMADIISQCERRDGNSRDENLTKIVYNRKAIARILRENKIEKIFFTSRYVEMAFRKHFGDLVIKYPKIKYYTLPSPSPRYARMTVKEKVKRYKELLGKATLLQMAD